MDAGGQARLPRRLAVLPTPGLKSLAGFFGPSPSSKSQNARKRSFYITTAIPTPKACRISATLIRRSRPTPFPLHAPVVYMSIYDRHDEHGQKMQPTPPRRPRRTPVRDRNVPRFDSMVKARALDDDFNTRRGTSLRAGGGICPHEKTATHHPRQIPLYSVRARPITPRRDISRHKGARHQTGTPFELVAEESYSSSCRPIRQVAELYADVPDLCCRRNCSMKWQVRQGDLKDLRCRARPWTGHPGPAIRSTSFVWVDALTNPSPALLS